MVSWSEATEQRGLAAAPLTFRRCVIPETGDRKADLRIGSIWDDVKVAADSRTARICLRIAKPSGLHEPVLQPAQPFGDAFKGASASSRGLTISRGSHLPFKNVWALR